LSVVVTTAADDDVLSSKIGNAGFDLAACTCVRDFDLAGGKEEGGITSDAVAMAALDSDSVFFECGIIRRLAMLLVG